jgi:hypothetical protein
MTKRTIVLAFLAVIAAGVLAGCSSSSGPEPAALAQPAATTAIALPAATTAVSSPTAPAGAPQSGGQSDADLLAALASGKGNNEGAAPAVQSDFSANSTALNPGDALELVNDQATLDLSGLGAQAHFYHVTLPDGKTVYFFVVKDKNGVIRAAANACQVCFSTKRGFHQEDGWMVCNTCGNRYPLEKIATEKGGCNPVPINPNLKVSDGKAILQLADLEPIANYF